MRMTSAAPLLALLLLVGCRSDPVHYHTLTPLLSAMPSLSQTGHTLQVERVTVPPQVDRAQLVVRQGANELVILETDWWGASLVDEVQSTLTDQLNARPGASQKASVRIDVQRFDLLPGQYALIDVRWRIRVVQPGSENATELMCRSLLQTPAGSDIQALVVAQQKNVQRLAVIMADANRLAAKQCP